MSIDGVLQTAAYNGASAECVWRVVLERNKCVQISFYGRLHDTDLQPFWWLYCRSAADYHGVALQQLVVVNTIAHSCNILIDVDLWDEGRDTLYFHRLPIMSNDEVPSPFGYWSFDREPSPGPWPDISIPGMKMQYRYEYRYTYLSALQAQLATCFSDCLWASCPPLPFPQRSAIDNTESFRSSGSHSPNTWSTHRGHDNDDDHSYCSDSASIVDDECYETADEYVDND
ncbi:hypothetical protein CERSUDRAFT_122744 [Gelatoporia subvermispora B]|uniref:Uncharacterized protein n=1 Tax=Ceriporiopsis subvermispora (strain B) TaxID=914234 RepID=M2QQJ9_CERS8|nr:hypothetical protein CERSUDRAFT_122744 [Gelatoporia subvermispora B]